MSEKGFKDFAGLGHVNLDAKYDKSNTTNHDLIERRNKHFAGSFLFYHDPIHIVKGKGSHLFDDKGRRYVDFYNNVAVVGHANPRVAKAISDQALKLNTHTRYLHENVIELAETVAETLPGDLEVCLFTCTGTEACELAMRIARVVTGNTGAIVMENSYHGNSKLVGEMSTLTYPASQRPAYIKTVTPPNTYRGPFCDGESDLGSKYANLIDPAINELQENGAGLAAFVCDTIFDSQGALEAPQDYFKNAYRKVRASGGLCIADEVQAGVGRTGKYWGFEHYDVVPDIVFTGKPFGNGHPVAAVFTTRAIADLWMKSDVYFNTFGGNPVSAAAAKAVFDILKADKILPHVVKMNEHLLKGLNALQKKHEIIGNIRGKGLFIGVELVKDRDTKEPAAEVARLLPDALKTEGILIGLTGPLGNVLKFRPPLVTSKADIDLALKAFDKILSQLEVRQAEGEIPAVDRITDGVVSERALTDIHRAGHSLLSIAPGVVVTPLARDKAKELGITIEQEVLSL
ncbi:MAG: aminotransferase class III-fold pyridoxal phosphate-dependent enzyme [Pseudomonadales bacterium]